MLLWIVCFESRADQANGQISLLSFLEVDGRDWINGKNEILDGIDIVVK